MAPAGIQDTNIAGIGSAADHALRKAAAQTEPAWASAGVEAGVQVWRVEKLQLKTWPAYMYGQFYEGDSYVILHSFREHGSLTHRVHFWLGQDSSIDETAVAAYKTVELCDYLDGRPKQVREVQREESREFQEIFPSISYLPGGIESGLRQAAVEGHVIRLYEFSKGRRGVRQAEVKVLAMSLTENHCFVLDAWSTIYILHGSACHPLEKYESTRAVGHMAAGRKIKPEVIHGADEQFCRFVGRQAAVDIEKSEEELEDSEDGAQSWATSVFSSEASDGVQSCATSVFSSEASDGVQSCATSVFSSEASDDSDASACSVLYKLSDERGKLQLSNVASGRLSTNMLDSSKVMILDANDAICIWVGADAGTAALRGAWRHSQEVLKSNTRHGDVSVHMFKEGQKIRHHIWRSVFDECSC